MANLIRDIVRHPGNAINQLYASPWAPWGPELLQPEAFEGKRVIVVGPAETVLDDLKNTIVDNYDVVVRLNNGIALKNASPDILGQRTDLLVHNLREYGDRSAGAIPTSFLLENQVGGIVYPHWHKSRLRKLFREKRKALKEEGGPPLTLIPPWMMRKMRAEIGDRPPTVGTCALLFFLDSPAIELAIHGFTFFETVYAPGYNDTVKTADDARAWVDARGAHEPKLEKTAILRRLETTMVKSVTMGCNVKRHLYADR
ncbi:hypothetical protein [uncultured Jannaschia sp.]|uniref:hypothetical protein n=1 Tax=uncultured Jannaschia sp. TaxID=293347 RepID=UPI002635AE81|nr:hypothetical protein [uncultured Jannaschia sp.]